MALEVERFMLDLNNDLNDRQIEAATHVEGPLLVIAGAGSGKTRVITYRVAHLLANGDGACCRCNHNQ